MQQQGYDVIVIGGGSAGCAAAARLSEDPGRRVLLLEAGPDPDPIPEMVARASEQPRLLMESPHVVMYPTTRKADGSTLYKVSGRIMGGGSSVNVMAAIRPVKHDLDTWASLGSPGWTWDECLPVFRRMESDQDFPHSPLHGSDGPLYIKRPFTLDMEAAPPVRAFIERAVAMGLPEGADHNVPDPHGVYASSYNVKDGLRQSTTVAYLQPARGRANLTVIADAPVLSLQTAGARVTSVTYRKDGQTHSVTGGQVVVSAGAYHSPQVLMLSGIGPAKQLETLGIRVVHALEGVGENYQDHAVVHLTFEGRTDFKPDWVYPRFKVITRSDPSQPCANFHLNMRPPTVIEGAKQLMPISAHLLEQRNRGRVSLKSADPDELPEVISDMLEDPEDLRAMTNAMQFLFDMVQHPSMQQFYGPLVHPSLEEDWGLAARSTHTSYHHGAGTCVMGPASDTMAVVDERLRVHGMDNLWVADASIMPIVSHANTNLTCIMIGERVSDFLKQAT